MLSAIQTRKAQVLGEYETLHNPRDGVTPERFEAEQGDLVARCRARHAATQELVGDLTRLSAYCQQVLAVEGRT